MPPREISLRIPLNGAKDFSQNFFAELKISSVETVSFTDIYKCAEDDFQCRYQELLADRRKKAVAVPTAPKVPQTDPLLQFDPTNPIHDRLKVDAEGTANPEQIKKTEERARRVLDYVNKHEANAKTPEERFKLLDEAMKSEGFSHPPLPALPEDHPSSYAGVMSTNNKELHCDPWHFTEYVVAQQKGWPVYMVNAPEHIYLRHDDGKSQVSHNFEKSYRNGEYEKKVREELMVDPRSEQQGVFFQNLNPEKVQANYYHTRAIEEEDEDPKKALRDYDEALRHDPEDPLIISNRGQLKRQLNDDEGARKDFDKALDLDPNNYTALKAHADLKMIDHDVKGALKDYDHAIEVFASYRSAGFGYKGEGNSIRLRRAFARVQAGDLKGAKEDYQYVVDYEVDDEKRARAESAMKQVEAAIAAENKKTTWFRRHVEFGLPELHMGTSITAPYTIRESSGADKKQMDSAFLGHLDFFKMGICLASCREKGALYRLGMDDDGMRFMFKLSVAMLSPENGQTGWYGGLAAGMEFYGAFLGVYGRLDMKVVDGFGKRWLMGPEINFKPFKLTKGWPHWLPGGSGIEAYYQTGGGEPDKWVFSLNAFFG